MEEQIIFTLDGEEYHAAHSLMEFLNWYNKNIDSLETAEQLQGLSMHDPEDIVQWTKLGNKVEPEKLEELKRAEQEGRNCTDELCRISGEIYHAHRYEEYMEADAKEPYLVITLLE